MHTNPSKIAADYLRLSLNCSATLKASHARELVAAYFGYKSHAALLADVRHPIENLEKATILIPDVPLLEARKDELNGIDPDVPTAWELAETIGEAITSTCFGGEIWLYDSLENYLMEELLVQEDGQIQDDLSGAMAETNASFDSVYYDDPQTADHGDVLAVSVRGVYSGTSDPDKMFSGDTIVMRVDIELNRCAGVRGFSDYQISTDGQVKDDWRN